MINCCQQRCTTVKVSSLWISASSFSYPHFRKYRIWDDDESQEEFRFCLSSVLILTVKILNNSGEEVEAGETTEMELRGVPASSCYHDLRAADAVDGYATTVFTIHNVESQCNAKQRAVQVRRKK